MTDPTRMQVRLDRARRQLDGVDHSAPSNTKYRQFEATLADGLAIDVESVYAAYISKAGNTRVRFDQSTRGQRARLLIALISPPPDEHPMQSVRALERYCAQRRPDAEILAFYHSKKRGWHPYAAVFVSSDEVPLLQPFIDDVDDLRVLPQTILGRPGITSAPRPSALRFAVSDTRDRPKGVAYPYVALHRENWPDGPFKTLFSAYFYSGPQEREFLGEVKILKRGQRQGMTEMPQGVFKGLGSNYCSLGQSHSYYETLRTLPQPIYQRILKSLRDVVYNEDIRDDFEAEVGFQSSLARTGKATLALREAGAYFADDVERPRHGLRFGFRTHVGGDPFDIDFAFNQSNNLPGRINAVIGYNGTGKTQLLANIALVATSDLEQRKTINNEYGLIHNSRDVRFSSVIAISYSAFDTFVLPDAFWQSGEDRRLAAKRLRDKGELNGYTYCGLRKRASNQRTGAPRGLKSIDELTDEFGRAVDLVYQSSEKRMVLREAMSIIEREPSFGRTAIEGGAAGKREDWFSRFNSFSTGHKIVLNVIVQIVAYCEPQSLILIDEPESHLHPSLLAALMRSLNSTLRRLDSYAIVATHSPVVLQEIPRNYVRILQRFGSATNVVLPKMETFGENVGYLTSNVFHLDSTETDFHSVLKDLAETKTLEDIEDVFDGEMSAQARAYVLGFMRSAERGR